MNKTGAKDIWRGSIKRVGSLYVAAGLELEAYRIKELYQESTSEKKSLGGGCRAGFDSFDKKKGVAGFVTRCRAGSWLQTVQFEDWDAIMELMEGEEGWEPDRMRDEDFLKKGSDILELLKDSNCIIWCECPSYRYTYAYLAHQLSYGELGDAYASPPDKRNPNYDGALCKHLCAVYDQHFR